MTQEKQLPRVLQDTQARLLSSVRKTEKPADGGGNCCTAQVHAAHHRTGITGQMAVSCCVCFITTENRSLGIHFSDIFKGLGSIALCHHNTWNKGL